ncbi:caspase-8-like isoform X1 [Oncorhynchus tshawytscha]|uniref:Caspase-8 n=2 Tax=Oncorhynchus tshawytscha TaxID=74940 RepID=A0A8C8IZE8_ONCTS|nr:caspase-8-like isoform X1 [Oncorhynchus tshawytscha]XP_024271954.1 caspase-8-like isoform X1 [Oncorhynchus tshawytscha]
MVIQSSTNRSIMQMLREKKTLLTEILSADSSYILQHVQQEEIVTNRDYNNLNIPNQSDEKTVVNLLDKVMNKGDTKSYELVNLLQKPHIIKNYPRLEEIFNNHTEPSDHTFNPAPTIPIPCTDNSDLETVVTGGDEVSLYEMTSVPRGLCLIINNEIFEELSERKGSNKDAVDLANIFSRMKFRVVMCKDKTAVEIPRVLKVFSELKQLSDLQQYNAKEWVSGQFTDLKDLPKHGDAFVCCILSHGKKEGVCGTDGTVVPTIDILSPFNGTNCSILVEKPKLFFIQACRGKDVQKGVPVNKKPKVEGTDMELDTDDGQVQDYTLPLYSDYLVFMANVDQYISIRSPTSGSWFIQSLCGQLEKSCTRGKNIYEILTGVKAAVSKKKGDLRIKDAYGGYGYEVVKQSPDSRDTLTKMLIFPAETTHSS